MNKAPTQALLFFLAAAVVIATTCKYLSSNNKVVDGILVPGWEPSWEWLIFLMGIIGAEAVRFLGKRRTNWSPKELAEAERIKNSKSEDR
jgi:hypothetical protein